MKFGARIVCALGCLLMAANAHAQDTAPYTLTYNAADGSLTIDALENPLYTYSVKSTGVFHGEDGSIEANHTLLPDAPGGLNTPANTLTDKSCFNPAPTADGCRCRPAR